MMALTLSADILFSIKYFMKSMTVSSLLASRFFVFPPRFSASSLLSAKLIELTFLESSYEFLFCCAFWLLPEKPPQSISRVQQFSGRELQFTPEVDIAFKNGMQVSRIHWLSVICVETQERDIRKDSQM